MRFNYLINGWPARCARQLWMAVLAVMLMAPLAARAESKADKAYKKQCQKEIKRLQKEGWKVYGSPQTLEDVLMPYYQELANGAQYIQEQQTGNDVNVAMSKTRHFAEARYASIIESSVKAEMENEMKNVDSGNEVTSEETFRANFKSKVEKRIKGFKPRVTLTRRTDDGKVEVMQCYIYKLEE